MPHRVVVFHSWTFLVAHFYFSHPGRPTIGALLVLIAVFASVNYLRLFYLLNSVWTCYPTQLCRVTLQDAPLGTGAYGQVCKATLGELHCAAKLLHPILVDPSRPRNRALFEQECEICHPNIVPGAVLCVYVCV